MGGRQRVALPKRQTFVGHNGHKPPETTIRHESITCGGRLVGAWFAIGLYPNRFGIYG
jgi:hypothetical protein